MLADDGYVTLLEVTENLYQEKLSKSLLQSHLTMLKTRNAQVLKWRMSTSGTADFRHFKMFTRVF